jgi:hypothetical protein
MPGHGEKQGRKQEAAIAALLAEPTVEAAAAKIGVAHGTLKRWLLQPKFAAAYGRARQEILERTVIGLLAVSGQAVETLKKNLTCGVAAAENRAAELILGHATKGVEMLHLVREVEDLKREMEAMKNGDSKYPEACGPTAAGTRPAAGEAEPTAGVFRGEPGGLPG